MVLFLGASAQDTAAAEEPVATGEQKLADEQSATLVLLLLVIHLVQFHLLVAEVHRQLPLLLVDR